MSHRTLRVFPFGLLVGVFAAGMMLHASASVSSGYSPNRFVGFGGTDTPGCSSNPTGCATIQYAINESSDGDVIEVAPGVYTGAVVEVNKILTLVGANAGMDPRSSDPTCPPAVTPASVIDGGIALEQDNIVLDGFTVENAQSPFGVTTSALYSGYQIINNVIRDNDNGLWLFGASATPSIANQNCFANNLFESIVGADFSVGDLLNAVISNNNSDNEFVVFADDSILISGNNVIGSVDDAIVAIGSRPTTTVNINHNVIDNSGCFCGNADGIYVDAAGPVTINRNSITNSAGFGIETSAQTHADGSCNWWGTPTGPSGEGLGSGDTVSTHVSFEPWLLSADLNGPCTGYSRHGVFDVTSHDFATFTVGTTSPTFNFNLTNSGATGPLHISTVSLVGANPTQFQIVTNNCSGVAVPLASSCSVGIAFAPTATGGQAATLRIVSDDVASPTDATLTGIGGATPAKGSITIVEDSLPDATRRFLYAGDLGAFVLTDPSKRQHTFSNLTPGTFEVSQLTNPAAWSLLDISCSTAQTTSLGTGTVSINLTPGANMTCTFSNAFRRPDGLISLDAGGPFIGDNVYMRRARLIQTVTRTNVAPGQSYSYFVRAQNDGVVDDTLTLQGVSRPSSVMTVQYFVNGVDQTAAIAAATYSTGVLTPGSFQTIEIRVTVAAGATRGRERASLRIRSAAKPLQVDTVRATTTL